LGFFCFGEKKDHRKKINSGRGKNPAERKFKSNRGKNNRMGVDGEKRWGSARREKELTSGLRVKPEDRGGE